jgi:hemerythrin
MWEEKISVGINEMDNQHKILISIINNMESIFEEKKIDFDIEIQKEIVKLKKYTVVHFSEEESLMEKNSYEDLDIHKEAHDNFIKLVNEQQCRINSLIEQKNNLKEQEILVERYNQEIYVRVEKIITFLQKWLISHIMKVDKGYMDCCKD